MSFGLISKDSVTGVAASKLEFPDCVPRRVQIPSSTRETNVPETVHFEVVVEEIVTVSEDVERAVAERLPPWRSVPEPAIGEKEMIWVAFSIVTRVLDEDFAT
jgi:hypothetical protein